MNLEIIFDPLFRTPFVVGLIVSATLPLLGNLLRLRDEWLAALGLAYLAGASGLLGLAFGVPAVMGAPLGALAGAAVKAFGSFRGNTVYALMVVVGWATTMLIAANSALGSVVGHALVEGQLYLTGSIHLYAAVLVAGLCGLMLPRVTPPLVRARLLPGHAVSPHGPAWQWHLAFDGLAALGMAVGAGTVGLMGAFALAFVPSWTAFRVARSWRHCQLIGVGVGAFSYVVAFAIALSLDQPFGPVLVAVLVVVAIIVLAIRSY